MTAGAASVEEAGSMERGGTDTSSGIPSQHAHQSQMRRIVEVLRGGMERLGTNEPSASFFHGSADEDGRTRKLIRSARISSKKYRQQREVGVKNVLKRLKSATTTNNTTPIDTLCMKSDGVSWEMAKFVDSSEIESECSSSGETFRFKRQYIYHNIPCVIRGLDKTQFASVTSQWRTFDNSPTSIGTHVTPQINTGWFRRFIGNETMVPVRFTYCDDYTTANDVNDQGLDDEGRAKECNIRQMTLDEWISICQNQHNHATPINDRDRVEWYLKDWHLLQFLAHQDSPSSLPLYTTPRIFERDILNRFLERCCTDGKKGGDYKFVYWGPAGSRTSLHSDVLHSFSWSYNVVGMKKWIFHVPPPSTTTCSVDNDHECMEKHCFEVTQRAGETIFVPSTWKHEVVNLVETLSINHNWITPANVDQAWICLQTEIAAVEEEVQSWGVIPADDFEARENMLRGCIGLDCTQFTLMVLLEIVELLLDLNSLVGDDDDLWDCTYSILRLEEVLVDILRQVDLIQRMTAGFGSETYALEVKGIANDVIRLITKLHSYPD